MPRIDTGVRLDWDTDQILATNGNQGSLAIKVNRAEDKLTGKRYYSYEFGRVNREGAFTRYLAPLVERTVNYQATIRFVRISDYAPLMDQVESYIQEGIQAGFDTALDRRREAEERDVAKQRPVQRPGLKRIAKKQEGT